MDERVPFLKNIWVSTTYTNMCSISHYVDELENITSNYFRFTVLLNPIKNKTC